MTDVITEFGSLNGTKVSLVVFEANVINWLRAGGGAGDFLRTQHFPHYKPSSTARLTYGYLQAFQTLGAGFRFSVFDGRSLTSERQLADISRRFDRIVIIAVASQPSNEFVCRFLDWAEPDILGKTIWGTEVSWDNELAKGTFSQEQVRRVYCDSLLLRHSARTEKHVLNADYWPDVRSRELPLNLSIEEFELDRELPRRYCTLVLGPDGRKTKNNQLAFDVINSIDVGRWNLEYMVVRPPYSVHELRRIFQMSKYLIFTSAGESFSYVLNDARLQRVLTFHLDSIFDLIGDLNLRVPAYADSQVPFNSIGSLENALEAFERDNFLYVESAESARQFVKERFTTDPIARRLHSILDGRNPDEGEVFVEAHGDTEICAMASGFQDVILTADERGCAALSLFLRTSMSATLRLTESASEMLGDSAKRLQEYAARNQIAFSVA